MVLTTVIGGDRATQVLSEGTYLIGRGESCRIRLPFPDVSERHAILTVRDGRAVLEDLHSANGTFVNGEMVDAAVTLGYDMVVQIGSSMLRVSDGAAQPPPPEPEIAEPAAPADDEPPAAPDDAQRELRRNVQTQIQNELLKRMDMKKLTVEGVDREGLEDRAREKIRQIVDEVVANGRLPEGIDPVRLEDDVFN